MFKNSKRGWMQSYSDKATAASLHDSEEFIRRVLDVSRDNVAVMDRDGALITMNAVGRTQMGIDDFRPYVGRLWLDFWQDGHRPAAESALAESRSRHAGKFEGACLTAAGALRWWDVVIAPVAPSGGGEVEAFLAIARDITAAKDAALEIARARAAAEDANAAKSEFLATIAHEIRTPVGAMIGLTGILQADEKLTARQKSFVDTLHGAAETLLSLVNNLLDIASIEARSITLERTAFRLSHVLRDVSGLLAAQAAQKAVTFDIEDSGVADLTFIGDPARIRQIVTNLCGNAIKFSQNSAIHLGAGYTHDGAVCISVRDHGIGIPPEKLDTLFQSFVQADPSIHRLYGGTGLGLAITKSLVEIMGGTITAQSVPGKGSTFTALLRLELSPSAIIPNQKM